MEGKRKKEGRKKENEKTMKGKGRAGDKKAKNQTKPKQQKCSSYARPPNLDFLVSRASSHIPLFITDSLLWVIRYHSRKQRDSQGGCLSFLMLFTHLIVNNLFFSLKR